jgi:hypothetical protein
MRELCDVGHDADNFEPWFAEGVCSSLKASSVPEGFDERFRAGGADIHLGDFESAPL